MKKLLFIAKLSPSIINIIKNKKDRSTPVPKLTDLRKKIDTIDKKIIELLNERSNVVLDVGKAKQDKNLKIHSPERERAIFEKLKKQNPGPFPDEALKLIYEEIVSASIALQEPLKVAYFGPAATYTHLAARKQFGSSTVFMPSGTIKEVFEAVARGTVQYGVVPVENSTEGVVNYTLDMFIDSDMEIAFEIMLPISHNLLSKTGKRTGIKKICSHTQPLAQCRNWIAANFPGVPLVEEPSTATAAKQAAKNSSIAAIASELAAPEYKLKFIEKGIEDNRNNFTRFLVISKESQGKTGKDKTSLMISVKDNPGALYSILTPFAKNKINMTKIESRPSRKKAWEYIFFVDMEGHIEDKKINKAIDEVRKECHFLKVLGSYPSAELQQ